MRLRLPALSALFLSAILQPACATSAMPSKCTASGSLTALAGMDAQAICDRFTSDLAAALGPADAPEGLAIALTIHKRGAIDAVISARHEGRQTDYPAISVDAIDRALQPDDIGRLADAAAQVLAAGISNDAGRTAAPNKGE
jgi:hypothetical protein